MSRLQARRIIVWSFYDWANSAFSTVIITFVFSTYFTKAIAENAIIGTQLWGYGMGLSGILVAILSPIFGAIADHGGHRKRWLGLLTGLVAACSALLWFAAPSPSYTFFTLICVVAGTVAYEVGIVFYNTFLPDVAPQKYLGRVSGWAWGFGYVGGLVCLIIALFGFVQAKPEWLNAATYEQIRITGPLVACWIILFSLPLFFWIPEKSSHAISTAPAVRHGIQELKTTLSALLKEKNILLFLIAHMIYIDGLNSIFMFGGIYAAGTFGMSFTEVIQFGIATNVAAGIGAISLAWVDDYLGSKPAIILSLCGLFITVAVLMFVDNLILFWVFGIMLSLFVGPAQAASRTLLVTIVPREKITEMFGLYAFSGRMTAVAGPWLFGFITAYFDSQRLGVGTVLPFLLVGTLILLFVRPRNGKDHVIAPH
ncbi:MAG: MFS transporter [Waddliaceae bacterium]